MKFCYNCGSALSGTEKFCGQCGARIEHKPAAPVQEQQCQQSDDDKLFRRRKCSRHGIIFTNLDLLSASLKAVKEDLVTLLEKYAEVMVSSDIDYRLVDASNYNFVSDGAGRKSERASLHGGSTWVDYQHILYDIICYEKERKLPESNYLFIIGGHDVVPMPVINHYITDDPDFSDDDIETDLLYSYPYGPHTQASLESQELYKQEMYFLSGRLPIPTDARGEYLRNYLQNAVNVRNGIPVTKLYAQCDPHWKQLTASLMEPYSKLGLLPDRGNISGRFCYERVLLGPEITSEHIASVMEVDTDLIYLNLHGSSHPSSSSYVGEFPPKTRKYLEIYPTSAMRIPERYNIFVAEACYGGRFIGYDSLRSMIQAGLAHKTVLGLASSRIAFGTSAPPASSADVICAAFLIGLFSGYSAGEAMVYARRMFFDDSGMLSDTGATTLAEFNLFGDPSLHAAIVRSGSKTAPPIDRKVAPKDFPIGYESKTLKGAPAANQSLLERVRGAVDANVQAISDMLGKELYEQYGLTAREPQTIKRVKYANGQERLLFTYCEKSEGSDASYKTLWRVTTTKEGKIDSVLTSK